MRAGGRDGGGGITETMIMSEYAMAIKINETYLSYFPRDYFRAFQLRLQHLFLIWDLKLKQSGFPQVRLKTLIKVRNFLPFPESLSFP